MSDNETKIMIDSEPVIALMDYIHNMVPDSDEKAVQLWNAVSYEIFKARDKQ